MSYIFLDQCPTLFLVDVQLYLGKVQLFSAFAVLMHCKSQFLLKRKFKYIAKILSNYHYFF